MSDGETVLERLREQPGGVELARLAGVADGAALVGGAVRDLLLGRVPRELDVVVAEDAERLANELAAALPVPAGARPVVTLHERFGTAVVQWPPGRIDIARRRAESYPVPGALPEVRPGGVGEDLARRDFTVNALAVPLGGSEAGELLQAEHGSEDLHAGRLRVLHDESFVDDPTRLLRLARYEARLGFEIEEHTAQLASEALAAGALMTVSGARLGAELRLALEEPDALAALDSLAALGVLAALGLDRPVDNTVARRALVLLPADGAPHELLLAALVLANTELDGPDDGVGQAAGGASITAAPAAARERLRALLDHLEFTAGERDRALSAAFGAPALAAQMAQARRRSQLREALAGVPPEAVALAGGLGSLGDGAPDGAGVRDDPYAQARLWLEELRHVRLLITGEDLLAAGLSPGPQIGLRLKAALASKLDGELARDDAGAELEAALEASP